MATYVQTTLDEIDFAIAGYAESVFTGFAGPITTTIQIAGVVGLALIGVNAVLQWAPIRVSEYITWGVRYVIILAVATSWSQFLPFYDILTNAPGAIGAALLDVTEAPNLNVALDAMITELLEFSDRAAEEASWMTIDITSVLLLAMGAMMACIAIMVSAFAKIGLAMAVSIAPVFIAALLFRGTSDLFASWSRFTIGFALIPLVLAGVMGAVLSIGEDLIEDAQEATMMAEAAGFLIVALAAIVMMGLVPTMVNGLAGSIVATTSGIKEARGAGTVAASGLRKGGEGAGKVARGVGGKVAPGALASYSAAGAARAAPAGERIQNAIADYQSAREAGKKNRERYMDRTAMISGRRTSWAERREADRAGRMQQARTNIRSRDASPPPPPPPPADGKSNGPSSPVMPMRNRPTKPGDKDKP